MKLTYKISLISLITLLALSSCEDFLDKSPNLGLSEQDVYKNYNSITGFLDYAYGEYVLNYLATDEYSNGRNYQSAVSDEFTTSYNLSTVLDVHAGNWLKKGDNETFEIGNSGRTPIARSYKGIRVMNRILENLDKVPNLTETEYNNVRGQAIFYRSWFYFQLIIRYGGMPKLDKVFVGDGDEDIPRMTYHESHNWMMEDINASIELLPEYWDNNNTGRPTKMAAMAFKAMAQLYDASPLMQNDLKQTIVRDYDKERAALAAKYADDVVKYLTNFPSEASHKYRLMSKEEYKNIFYFARGNGSAYVQDESIWYCRRAVDNRSLTMRRFFQTLFYDTFSGPDAASCFMPTQNMANLYEKKGSDGNYYPITDPRSGYNLQEPFKDRDPRFENNFIVPGQAWGFWEGKTLYVTLFKNGDGYNRIVTNSNSNQRGQTGYLCKKFQWEEANFPTNGYEKYYYITNYIRVAQVYLDYAEASFEATGSATARVPGCSMSAEEALNVVRNRVGMSNVVSDIVNDPVKFRQTLRNERSVELMFECHRWFDIRRWMVAHELFAQPNPIKGILAVPNNVPSAEVPSIPTTSTDPNNGKLTFIYEEYTITPEVRVFGMKNYWYPFTINEVASLKNLEQNPGW
jgi:hypothetical protein